MNSLSIEHKNLKIKCYCLIKNEIEQIKCKSNETVIECFDINNDNNDNNIVNFPDYENEASYDVNNNFSEEDIYFTSDAYKEKFFNFG